MKTTILTWGFFNGEVTKELFVITKYETEEHDYYGYWITDYLPVDEEEIITDEESLECYMANHDTEGSSCTGTYTEIINELFMEGVE